MADDDRPWWQKISVDEWKAYKKVERKDQERRDRGR